MNDSITSFGDFSNGHQLDHPSISSPDDSNNTAHTHSFSDEDVILASMRPKKRAGRKIFHETRHPVYRGVRLRNKTKWVCEMRVPNNNKSRIWLGTYPTPEMAARAHDVAALTFRGKSACLNFADSAWRVTLPVSTDAADIRRAAMEAAVMFSSDDEINNDVEVEDGVLTYDEALQQQGMYVYEEELFAPVVSPSFEYMYDMPIMSPSPSIGDFAFSDSYVDVEIFDTPVSLWNL